MYEFAQRITTLRKARAMTQEQLAQELGFSRTPVREALVRLMDEFLVAEADGNKFRVSEISWKWTARLFVISELRPMVQ